VNADDLPAPGRRGGLDLVLWDLDGTITDSQAGIAGAYRHVLDSLGLQADAAAIRACIGPPISMSLASLGVPPDRMGEAIDMWRAWFGVHGIFDNAVYDGIPEVLARVQAAGVPMGLATAKLHRYAVEILDHFALSAYFDPVAGATSDGRLTTKDEIVAAALLEVGVTGSDRVLMIGDREHDMYGAIANHVAPVGVLYGYGSRAELEGGGARWLVDSPAALGDLILGLASGR
jgi:phosphoglycolate phosphatase